MNERSLYGLLRRAALALGALAASSAALPGCGVDVREVECFAEGAETCGKLTYCRPDLSCASGCENDRECEEGRPATPFCRKENHQCVACRTGTDCREGEFCNDDGSCGAGCDDGQGKRCPEGQLCCNHICSDPASSALHCGSCDKACKQDTEACCASSCVDTLVYSDDVNNCGGCGVRCVPGQNSSRFTCEHGTCVYQCDPGFADCDPDVPGCESDLGAVTSCGGCDHRCNTVGSDMRCQADPGAPGKAACVYTKCLPGYADCDQGANPDNGCEADLSSPEHCGECGAACSKVHGAPSCSNGTCSYAKCDGDWADCRGASAENPHNLDGCESDLNAVASCGACGVSCQTGHGTAHCSGKSCAYECTPGFGDCQKAGANAVGCETDLSDASNCGGCGVVCGTLNATGSSCQSSKGSFACVYSCVAPFADCTSQPGCETNLSKDPDNCGGCGVACNAAHTSSGEAACASGKCQYAACLPGYADCDADQGVNENGCETPIDTPADCGGCHLACPDAGSAHATTQPVCSNGSCQYGPCAEGFGDCNKAAFPADFDGCETSLTTVSNCGACGQACDAARSEPSGCDGQRCLYSSCKAGWANCAKGAPDADGCETNTDGDPKNCGGCGIVCNAANSPSGKAACVAGKCVYDGCLAGHADCDPTPPNTDGCETDLENDPAHCGQCGNPCGSAADAHALAPASCSSGVCSYSCQPGWASCNGASGGNSDGCETSLTTVSNCGGCGQACDTVRSEPSGCDGTSCQYAQCKPGWTDCAKGAPDADGCETNTDSDPKNCGGCGIVCDAGNTTTGKATCSSGKCQYAPCLPGYADCDAAGANPVGCETQIAADAANCGACGNACSPAGAANATAAPACAEGVCTYACAAGFTSCNGSMGNADGCETSLKSTSSCGGCGVQCDASHAAQTSCDGAKCVYACAPGWNDCKQVGADADGCETPTGPDACGGCQACASDASVQSRACLAGKCSYACSPGYADCNAAAAGVDADGCECKRPLYGDPQTPTGCCASGCMKTMQTGLTADQVAQIPVPKDWQPGSGWKYPATEPPSSTYLTCSKLSAHDAAQLSCLATTKPGNYGNYGSGYQYQDNTQLCSDAYIRYLPVNQAKQAGGYCQPMPPLAPFGDGTHPCVCWFFYSGLDFDAVGKVSFSLTGCRAPLPSDPTFSFDP